MQTMTTEDVQALGIDAAREDHARMARGYAARGMESHWHDTLMTLGTRLPKTYGEANPVWAYAEAYIAEYRRIAWHASAAT